MALVHLDARIALSSSALNCAQADQALPFLTCCFLSASLFAIARLFNVWVRIVANGFALNEALLMTAGRRALSDVLTNPYRRMSNVPRKPERLFSDSQNAVAFLCGQLWLTFATRHGLARNLMFSLSLFFLQLLFGLRSYLLQDVLNFRQTCDKIVLRFLGPFQSSSVTFRIRSCSSGDF